ncbi:MAG: LamG domain-containing protein [Lewinellaceae bacterium]|nr:LamG domain-containing protein [Lewinellaceae bacterium]
MAARAKNQLLALYTFEAGSGTVVHDVSGADVPLHLAIGDPTKANWIANGLSLTGPAALVSDAGASRIADAIKASNELTIEAWIKPASDNVTGLARIVTLSGGPAARNFTIGQRGAAYHAHLRSTGTNLNASNQAMAGGAANTSDLIHLVCTRDAAGITRLFVNGQQVSRRVVNGDFSNWDNSFRLALGDDFNSTDGHIRTWPGEYHLVAIYSRALSPEEIVQNFDFGADANLPPVVSAGPDLTVNWPDWTDTALPQPAGVSAGLNGRVTHDRVSPLQTTRWTQVGGPGSPDGVAFTPDNAPATTAVFREKGRYVLRLSSNDGSLLMNDDVVVVVNRPPQVVFEHGNDLKFALTEASGTITLDGKLTENGWGDEPAAHAMTYRWSLASGPSTAVIEHPDQLSTSVRFTGRGIYELVLEANNGFVTSRFRVGVVVSQRPAIAASVATGPRIELMLVPATQITLSDASVIDNGLGDPTAALELLWEKVSGEGTVTFNDPNVLNTPVVFSQNGVYVLQLTATNPHHPELTASSQCTVIINQRPVVDAGPDPAPLFLDLTRPGSARVAVMLDGTASDDGLPGLPGLPGLSGLPWLPNPGLLLLWTKVSGPGTVRFTPPDMDYTEAEFTQKGKYVLKLEAGDGHLTAEDTVTVIVNATPLVEAGPNRKVITTPTTPPGSSVQPLTLPLNGIIVDDGIGDPSGTPAPTTNWDRVSGPALPVPGIAAPDNLSTEATLDKNGSYEFKLTARNGFGEGFDSIFITAFDLSQVEILDEPGSQNRQFKFSCKIGGVLINAGNMDGLTFEWARFRVPTGVSAPQVSTPNGADTLIQFRGRGEHEIQLTITDAAGNNIAKRATITIV